MTSDEFNAYLKSIDGLENGFFPDRDPIKTRHFFSVGDGWLYLIKILIENCIRLGWDKQICQVKEKFGGLRFYINSASEEIHKLISNAESMSYYICEECGTTKNIGQTIGWIITICESCKNEHHPDKVWHACTNTSDKIDNEEFKKIFDGNT